jgi:Ca-activated chloride channel family protein
MAMAAPGGIGALRDMAMPTGGIRPTLARAVALGVSSPGARRLRKRRRRSAQKGSDAAAPAAEGARTVFSGTPTFKDGRAVLWEETLCQGGTLSRIEVAFADPAPEMLDRGLALWIYVEDLAMPRARIRLADLVRLGGERPLNLRVRAGERVRVVLVDEKGVWARSASDIVVRVTV